MKLLSTPAGKSRREIENTDQELRALELDTLIKAKRKELDQLDRLVLSEVPAIEASRQEDERVWKEKIAILSEQVERLERRKRLALVPLEEEEKRLQNKEDVLLERANNLLAKEAEVTLLQTRLESKLDEVSEREQSSIEYYQLLSNREFGVQLKEKEAEERLKTLNETLSTTFKETQEANADLARQKAILKGREVALSEREKNVAEKEASFVNREKAIIDRYRTLQRAITETNLKQNGNNRDKRFPS